MKTTILLMPVILLSGYVAFMAANNYAVFVVVAYCIMGIQVTIGLLACVFGIKKIFDK